MAVNYNQNPRSQAGRSKSQEQLTYTVDQVFDRNNPILQGLSQREAQALASRFKSHGVVFGDKTLQKANELLTYLKDNGYEYELQPRSDGKGLLAKLKGIGSASHLITVLPANDRDKNVDQFVGNVSSAGRVYYTNSNVKYKDVSPYDMIQALTGRMNTEVQDNDRGNSGNYDVKFVVRDNNGRDRLTFFRKRPSEVIVGLDEVSYEESYTDDLIDIFAEEAEEEEILTPLERMVIDTNIQIEELRNEEGVVTRSVNGIQEEEVIEPIVLRDPVTMDGLNLDTLLKFNDRSEIANVIGIEMRANEEFDLGFEGITGEQGLKNLLMEASAGINAERVEASTLGPGYQEVLEQTRKTLENHNISNVDIYFDSDHVIHWTGVENRKGKTVEAIEREGQIGQVFLPDENGIIRSKFNILEGEDDRNYNMVAGYAGYYTSAGKKTLKPKVVKGQDGKDYVADADGNMLLIPDLRMELDRRKNDPNGKPYTLEEMQRPWLATEFTPERLVSFNKHIKDMNNKYKTSFNLIETSLEEESLKDRLRLKGFDQALTDKIQATVARQVLQSDFKVLDNIDLNKLYHGDVYSERIKDYQMERQVVVDTKRGAVRFGDEVLKMSPEELGANPVGKDKHGNVIYEDVTHRYNLQDHEGIFDAALTSDGATIGLKKFLVEGSQVLPDGKVIPAEDISARAPVYSEMYATEADPSDRAMMAGSQNLRARDIIQTGVSLMNYKGHTIEDGSVISQAFAEEFAARTGQPPLKVGDKISDNHGNKSTISYIATPETDPLFAENPDLKVIMNPYSVTGRKNMGVPLEMRDSGNVKDIMLNGEKIAEMGGLNVIVTDITADSKTKIYEDVYNEHGELVAKSPRKGRSFGAQEGWIASALDMQGIMKEVYGSNNPQFEKLKNYLNVTGLDLDEDGNIYQGAGFELDENGHPSGEVVYPSEKLALPKDGGAMALPISVSLPGMAETIHVDETGKKVHNTNKTQYLKVLPEKYRKTQELYDGDRMYHEYSKGYARIAQSSLKVIETRDKIGEALGRDISDVDFGDNAQKLKIYNELSTAARNAEDAKSKKLLSNLSKDMDSSISKLEGHVNSLTSRVVNEKLGGAGYVDDKGKFQKDTSAVKQSITKREIMGAQVPNSVTAVVTAYSDMDINEIVVSPEIYEKMNPKDKDERVVLWRDPALHDTSMFSFKVKVDEKLTGVGFHPLVAQQLGLDYDGDQVALWNPKTPEARKDVDEKLAIEKRLLDPVNGKFIGDVGLDFVATAYDMGYVGPEIKAGPLLDKKDDPKIKEMGPKDQLEYIVTEMSKEEDGHKKISDLWRETVKSDYNIASSKLDVSSREATLNSMLEQAEKGAKGKKDAIISEIEEKADGKSFPEKVKKGYLPKVSSVMTNYDRGDYVLKVKDQLQKTTDPDLKQKSQAVMNWMFKSKKSNGTDNAGSIARDYAATRIASAQKAELTGQAGSKSQQLMVVAYDDPKSAKAVMRITEPLTQVVLKLKHDSSRVQPTKKIIRDIDTTLKKGGFTKDEFCDNIINSYNDGGLSVDKEDTETVFELLKTNVDGKDVTMSIEEAMEKKGNVLPKAGLQGFNVYREVGKSNSQKILEAAAQKKMDEVKLESIYDGYISSKHVPTNLKDVTTPSRVKAMLDLEVSSMDSPIKSVKDLSRSIESKDVHQKESIAKEVAKESKDPEVKREMNNLENKAGIERVVVDENAQRQRTELEERKAEDARLLETLDAVRNAKPVTPPSANRKKKARVKEKVKADDFALDM